MFPAINKAKYVIRVIGLFWTWYFSWRGVYQASILAVLHNVKTAFYPPPFMIMIMISTWFDWFSGWCLLTAHCFNLAIYLQCFFGFHERKSTPSWIAPGRLGTHQEVRLVRKVEKDRKKVEQNQLHHLQLSIQLRSEMIDEQRRESRRNVVSYVLCLYFVFIWPPQLRWRFEGATTVFFCPPQLTLSQYYWQ